MINNNKNHAPKTLVIQPLPGIGDMIWHIPYIRAIARSSFEGTVTLLSRPSACSSQIFTSSPWVSEHILLTRYRGIQDYWWGYREISQFIYKQNFDRLFLLSSSSWCAMLSGLSRVPKRYGYGDRWNNRIFLNSPPYLPSHFYGMHPLEKAKAFAELHNFVPGENDHQLMISTSAFAVVNKRFSLLPKPWIAFGIGASAEFRCWPLDYFVDLAPRILQLFPSATIFLAGGQKEQHSAIYIAQKAMELHKIKLYPVTDMPLTQTIALLSSCDLYVGNDTSLLNIAATTNVDAVGLFGVPYKPLDYSPRIKALKLPHHTNMAKIQPEEVIKFIEQQNDLSIWSHCKLLQIDSI